MAIRYLCEVSKNPDRAVKLFGLHLCRDLIVVTERPQFTLMTDSVRTAALFPGQIGAIIGHLFNKAATPLHLTKVDPPTARRALSTSGQSLLETHWGGYVAFLEEPDGGGISVVRDPSGAMPCYYIDLADRVVFASDVTTLHEAGYLVPQIDDTYLLHHLISYDLRTPDTGLKGVRELVAGHRLRTGRSGLLVESVWTPWDHVSCQPTSSDQLAEQLFETIKTTLGAWNSVFLRPLLGVSGGLDSSIIACALRANQSNLICYTMATDDAEGDERAYARLLTNALSVPLEERFYRLDEVDFFKSTAAHLPRPLLHAFGQSDFQAKMSISSAHGADAFFTGIGGDNVFCSLTSTLPVLDRLRAEGFGMSTWSTLNDVCRIAGCSVWQAFDNLLHQSRKKPYRYQWRRDFTYLPNELTGLYCAPTHPWLDAPLGALPGKSLHIAMMARIQGTIDGYERRNMPPLINPLLSQPIVEACLAIPTWRWLERGRNRSVARQAFSKHLPAEIINRRSKGGPSRFANSVINHNRAKLADRLEAGYLARSGLIDVQAVLRQLRSEHPLRDMDFDRFATMGEIEAWVSHWTNLASVSASQPPEPHSHSSRSVRHRMY